MHGRRLRSKLHLLQPQTSEIVSKNSDRQIKCFKRKRNLQLHNDEQVLVRNYTDPVKPTWIKGI